MKLLMALVVAKCDGVVLQWCTLLYYSPSLWCTLAHAVVVVVVSATVVMVHAVAIDVVLSTCMRAKSIMRASNSSSTQKNKILNMQ